MSDLKALLDAFTRGKITLEALGTSVDKLLVRSPEQVRAMAKDLKQAREAGLPRGIFKGVGRKLQVAANSAAKARAPAQSRPAGSDATVVASGAAAAPANLSAAATAPQAAAAPTDPDATVMAPETDAAPVDPHATVLAPENTTPGDVDIDITQFGADPGAEQTPAPPQAAASPDYDDIVDITTFGDPPPSSADATVMRAAPSTEDATALSPKPSAGDATVVATAASPSDDRTVAVEGGDATEGSALDSLAPSPMETAPRAAESSTGASRPTGDPRVQPAPKPGVDHEYREGSMLRGRFELISKLGEGGMGAVWKGKDMLKVEARDRNPYAAIKLLQGDFKQHPESFIALQRETAKQQRLAHPNIATVYDFDRDTDTDTVFMTMEVLDGEDLAGFIRKLPADGLSMEEAMPYIEQLCAGLAYAHHNKLVHSDLKPGNCFVTNDGRIKLLDFGIARASKTKADVGGETTVFDPGELGALTPTYATVEMFEGKDPDPRDDIYALAIMAYQLLTGKHPYGKQPAPKAMEQKLSPAPVTKLNKRQNRALMRGLAFLRDDRTPTVEEFLEDLKPKKSYFWQISAAAVVLVAIIAGGVYQPARQYFLEQRMNEVIALIEHGDEQSIQAGIAQAQDEQEFDEETSELILEDDRAKDTIFKFYKDRSALFVDEKDGQYDYPSAKSQLDVLENLYPDSAKVLSAINKLEDSKDQELSKQSDAYQEMLDNGWLIPSDERKDISDVLEIVAQVDPEHELLSDKELPIKFADYAQEAIASKDYSTADQFLKASLAYAPDDPTLSNLRYKVETELKRRRDAILVADIEQRLEREVKTFKSLADFQRVREDLINLADLAPANKVLTATQKLLKETLTRELDKLVAAKSWSDGEKLLVGFATLLDIPFLTGKRILLSKAEAAAGYELEVTAERLAAVEERKTTINNLLDNAQFTGEWEIALQLPYKELIALLPAGDPQLEPLRDKTARLYLGKARDSRASGIFDAATEFVDKGSSFYPGLNDFKVEQEAIAAAEAALREQQEAERLLARLKKLKTQVLADAKANKAQEAVKKLEELKRGLPANDPFLATEGPEAVALAYQRLAAAQSEQSNWENAAKLANAGLALAPGLTELEQAASVYNAEVEKIASIVKMRKQLAGKARLRFDTIKTQLAAIKAEFPDQWGSLNKEYAGLVVKRLKDIEKGDVAAAWAFRDEAKVAFPSIAKVRLKALPSPLAARGMREAKEGRLTVARATLDEAMAKDGADHPDIGPLNDLIEEKSAKAESFYKKVLEYEKRGDLKNADKYLVQGAIRTWVDNPVYQDAQKRIKTKQQPTKRGECNPNLAGHGTRSRGTCYDEIAKNTKGPVLVVVPAGGSVAKPFAIGKFEVSIADYNLYCKLSKSCGGVQGDTRLPVTGISINDAESYAKWLSEVTKASYRLPTASEWEYAATAGGKQPKKNFNCRVSLSGELIKGHSLVYAKAGDQNGWGLTNYVGNAQEWVKSSKGVRVRGGAFEDPLSKCDISVSRSHGGNGDAKTGFRLLREIS